MDSEVRQRGMDEDEDLLAAGHRPKTAAEAIKKESKLFSE